MAPVSTKAGVKLRVMLKNKESRPIELLKPKVQGMIMKATLLFCAFLGMAGCVTEAGHVHPIKLPSGKPGYVITCNSNSYDRCLNRATRVCDGAYSIIPETRSSTLRPGDAMPGVGNSESILVSCGN